MSHIVNIHEAKTNLSRLLAEVSDGADVVIANRGVPIARLVAYHVRSRPMWGSLANDQPMPDDAFAPMSHDQLREWGLV